MKALQYLTKLKDSHSKVKNIKHENMKLQPYLLSENKNLTINEKKFIFAARTRMLDLKGNFKTGMSDRKCCKCEATDETQLCRPLRSETFYHWKDSTIKI